MYKLVVVTALLAVAAAAPGYIGAPLAAPWGLGHGAPLAAPWGHGAALASPWGHGLVGSPYVSAPVVKAAVPVATSYANTVRIASPAVAVAHAPYAVAHAPALVASPYGHGW